MSVSLAAHRLPVGAQASREERVRRSREMLAHALTQGTTVAVVGSGCSAPLGYPTWPEFAKGFVDLAFDILHRSGTRDLANLENLHRFRARLLAPDPPKSEEMMFFVGACKRMLEGTGTALCNQKLSEMFQPREQLSVQEPNPHRSLLGLPIKRFVTTNYDCEIERALSLERGIDWARFGISTSSDHVDGRAKPLSFTQRAENCDQLALFALGRLEGADNMVFHCHGRFDDPHSMIASEGDYQRWYLGSSPESPPFFLQTIDLLFASNPILFVGYGLGDEDLLRPLRRIGAAAPERRVYRPLFALIPERPGQDEADYHERLFERYGLNVLPYPTPNTSDPKEWGLSLSSALKAIEEDRLKWRGSWLEKPKFRRVIVNAQPPEAYHHYEIESDGAHPLGEQHVATEIERLAGLAIGGAKAIILTGPGGTGKSWHATRLLKALERTREFESFFYWSSYYADDAVSGLDRLLAYIDRDGDRKEARLTRVRAALRRGRHAIVFDGFDRLLRPTDEDPQVGVSTDAVIKKFLEICADAKSRSVIIVTSRLWPKDLPLEADGIERKTLERLRTDDLISIEPFRSLERHQVSTLCSLLDGHTYAALLTARFLKSSQSEDLAGRQLAFVRELSATPSERRLERVIALVLADLDKKTMGLAHSLLEHLAVFVSPFTDTTVETCFGLARESKATWSREPCLSAEQVVDHLLSSRLIARVIAGTGETKSAGYVVHPMVRSYIFQGMHLAERDVLPNFALSGFTSGKPAVYPGDSRRSKLVTDLFGRLQERATAEFAANRREASTQLCRSLFGVVRSRMEANSAPRWCSYQNYLQYGLTVIDLAKSLSIDRWSFRERHERDEIEDVAAPLYADEVAFVYNDLGLAFMAEGTMHDTLSVWEQGYEINRLLEGTAEVPLYTLLSYLHLGHTYLELGNLRMADRYLEETLRANFQVKDPDYGARILGYQGVIAHYRNQLEEADGKYKRALRQLREAGRNFRAESFFLCHRSKNAIVRGDFDRAERYFRASRSLAQTNEAEDLVAYARAAAGRWYREKKMFSEANAEYSAALEASRRLGIRRLEAEILLGLSRTALLLGDGDLARQRAMASLALANELGLGLRVTQSLLVLGLAMRATGQPGLGAAYLELARDLGDEQEYWLRSREAEMALSEIGIGRPDRARV